MGGNVFRCHEDKDTADVIACMFFIHTALYFALIVIGSTYSYIASSASINFGNPVERTSREITVFSLLVNYSG